MNLLARRKAVNSIILSLTLAATAIGLSWLAVILWTLFVNGFQAISIDMFVHNTPPPGSQGGLKNAIFGTAVMTAVGVAAGAPIGVMAGTFLAEYGREGRLAEAVRFINDILLSAPSIVIGLFVYEAMVIHMGHFSAWSGAVALGIIVIPIVLRTTEDMLNLVPDTLREAAAALGAPKWRIVVQICYRASLQGLVTGVMLAVARVGGETAPLLFTALNNQFWSTNLNAPMANLPVVIFQFAMSPYVDWQKLAWGGALLITVAILALNIGARALTAWGGLRNDG